MKRLFKIYTRLLVKISDYSTSLIFQAPTNEVGQSIKDAVEVGYRHIDCALVYDNEKEVGDGIQEVLRGGIVKREDLFIIGKV